MDKRHATKSTKLEVSIHTVIDMLSVWLFVPYSRIKAFVYNAVGTYDILYVYTCTC